MSAANTLKKARNWLKKAFTSCRITYRWLNQWTAFCWPLSPFTPAGVLREIHDMLVGKFVISIVAGWTFDMLKDALPETARFVRVMPNTPLAVGEGMSLISSLCTCTDEEFAFTERIFARLAKSCVVETCLYARKRHQRLRPALSMLYRSHG